MSMADVYQRICALEGGRDSWPQRRHALFALAAIVTGALLAQAGFRRLDSPIAPLANAAVQLSVPFLVAWTLRRIAGRRIFAAAAIMVAGLLVPVSVLGPTEWAAGVMPNSLVATGMIWVISSESRVPTAALLGSATILAVAFAVSAII